MKSSLFLLLLVAVQITQAVLPWVSVDPQGSEAKQVAGWIIGSGIPEFSQLIRTNLIPLKAYNLLPDDKNSRLFICGYKQETHVDIFFVAIIHEKVVEVGNIHKAFLTPRNTKDSALPPRKGGAPPPTKDGGPKNDDPPELKLVENEAEKFTENNLATRTWKHKSEIPELKLIEAYYCQFELEFYYVGENGKILGIFSVLNTVDQNQYFCFGELEAGKPVLEYQFSGMGIHYHTQTNAFRDLEEYTNKRKVLLIDKWVNFSEVLRQTYALNILPLKKQTADRLKCPEHQIMTIEVKTVFDDPKKLMVIFKLANVNNCYVTVAGMSVSPSSSVMTLTFLDARAKKIEDARNVMENYFNLTFSDKFKYSGDPWVWGWEINNNISNESFPEKLISRNSDFIESEIKKSASFEIPEGGSIYLQKIRQRASVEGQFIGIYEFIRQIFMVIFIIDASSGTFSLTFTGTLGTIDEVGAAYEDYCAYGTDPEKFPFTKNSRFANGMGYAIRVAENLRSTFTEIFDLVKDSFDKEYTPKLEKGDVYINESHTTAIPAPFNRVKGQRPFWYCFRFEVDKKKTEKEGLIFFVIVKFYNNGTIYSAKLIKPWHPVEDTENARRFLKFQIYFDQFVSLVKPRIG